MSTIKPIHHPPTLINNYLADKINQSFSSTLDLLPTDLTWPFFPTMPTDIDALTETFPYADGRFAVYDRMFKMRRTAFPHIKSEQLMYYFYKFGDSPMSDIIEVGQIVMDFLDNGDESAEELNYWVSQNINADGYVQIGPDIVRPVFFHSTRVFQLEETQDIIDFGTARTYAGNKIIIDYVYHNNYEARYDVKEEAIPGENKLVRNYADPVRPFAPGIEPGIIP